MLLYRSIYILIALLVFIIVLMSPPIGDTWGYIVAADKRTIIEFFEFYFMGYMGNNPRIGQIPMIFAGINKYWEASIAVASVLLLLKSSLDLVKSSKVSFGSFRRIGSIFIVLGLFIHLTPIPGQMFFYMPFISNYVFGIGLLLFFLSRLAIHIERDNLGISSFASIICLGFLAGLTNEHTTPSVVALLVVASFFVFRQVEKLNYRFYLSGLFGLFIGYLALFFAPGQLKRYGERVEKNSGIESLIESPISQLTKVAQVVSGEYYLVLGLILVCLISIIIKNRKLTSPQTLACLFFVCVSIGIVITTAASPLIGSRLMFSAYCCLAIAATILLNFAPTSFKLFVVVAALGFATNLHFFSKGFMVYRSLAVLYSEQLDLIEVQKNADNFNGVVKVPPMEFNFNKYSKYVRKEVFLEDSNHRLNRARAHVYGVGSFSFETKGNIPK